MVAFVMGTLKEAEKDKTSGHGGVQDPEEDQRGDHEREGHFLVDIVANRSERGRCNVLVSGVHIHDSTDDAEHDDFADGHRSHGFPEVPGLLHFRDETGDRDLANEGVTDIQERIETQYKRRALHGNSSHYGLSLVGVASGVRLDARENDSQNDREKREECREGRNVGEGAERPGKREEERYHCHDQGIDNGTNRVVGDGVEVCGTHQAMQTLITLEDIKPDNAVVVPE